jgi:hypothetical protein
MRSAAHLATWLSTIADSALRYIAMLDEEVQNAAVAHRRSHCDPTMT